MITIEEAKKAMDEMMAQGTSEEEMLGILYLMFQDDKISLDELESLIGALGYEFTEEFMNMSPEQQKTDGFELNDNAEGVTDEQVEDAKETKGSEVQGNDDEEDGGNNQGEDQNADNDDNKKQPESEKESENNSKEDQETEERAKARKLYGFKD